MFNTATQPSAYAIISYRTRLLGDLAHSLLSADSLESRGGLRVIRDELRSLEKDIRDLEPEEGSLEWLLAECDKSAFTLAHQQVASTTKRRLGLKASGPNLPCF
jgi:hypothetical protein